MANMPAKISRATRTAIVLLIGYLLRFSVPLGTLRGERRGRSADGVDRFGGDLDLDEPAHRQRLLANLPTQSIGLQGKAAVKRHLADRAQPGDGDDAARESIPTLRHRAVGRLRHRPDLDILGPDTDIHLLRLALRH